MSRSRAGLGWFGMVMMLGGCTQSPEKLCETYGERRKELEWPTSPEIVKECTTELEAVKKRNPKAYENAAKCIKGGATDGPTLVQCAYSAEGQEGKEHWVGHAGIASDASGAWASEKGDTMSDEECNEAGFAIADKKSAFGILSTHERFTQITDLAKACQKQKKDAAAVANYKCMRRAKDKDAMFGCLQPGGGGAGSKATLIEGCVKTCKARPEAEYKACFTACSAGK